MYSLKLNGRKRNLFLLAMVLLVSVSGCNKTNEPLTKSSFKLNTIITITLYDNTDESIIDECFALCDKYENLLSRTIETSEIYNINNSNGTVEDVSKETIDILKKAIYYSELSKGAFDITIEPITSLWNIGSSDQRVPQQEEITAALQHIGYQNLIVNDTSITLLQENMGIDLGAIAKGYIADQIKELLLSRNVHSAIINLGGNVLCVGQKPDGAKFRIGIQKPFKERSETVAVMDLSDVSVVSSGIYERYFEVDGVSYHHILDPATGYPFDNGLISVTIVSSNSADGDALSTSCFGLGLEKGLELIQSLENTYAAFITEDGQLHYSEGFLENVTVTETE